MNLKLSRTALRELTRLYRGVLVAAMISAAFVVSGANAGTVGDHGVIDGDYTIDANVIGIERSTEADAAGHINQNGAYKNGVTNGTSGITLTIDDEVQFKNNKATATGTDDYAAAGGAIQNWHGNIVEIKNDVLFQGNSAVDPISDTLEATGGAIYSEGTADKTSSITTGSGVQFKENSAEFGGAVVINASHDVDFGKNVTFDHNEATDAHGGALIANTLGIGNITVDFDENATFSNNEAKSVGGAVVNAQSDGKTSVMTFGDGASFTDNKSTAGVGGAIYNNGTINFGNVAFSGNTDKNGANDIYNTGVLNFNGTATLEGGIDGNSGTTNIANTGSLTVANALKNQTVNNAGALLLDGADLTGTTITGAGTVSVAGDSEMTGANVINQELSVTSGQELAITGGDTPATRASITGSGSLNNELGGTLKITNADVYVDVTNAGTLISDPSTYDGVTVTNSGIASFEEDTFKNNAVLANTGVVNLADGVTFKDTSSITGAGTTNLVSGTAHFNDTANSNTINVASGADFDGTIVGGTLNAQNGTIDTFTGSIKNVTSVALDINTDAETSDTFTGGATNSVIKSLNLMGTYGSDDETVVTVGTGLTLDGSATINGGYYTKAELDTTTGKLTLSDKLINTSTIQGKDGATGDSVTIGKYADTTTVGTTNVNITLTDTTSAQKIDVKGNTTITGNEVVKGTFGAGTNGTEFTVDGNGAVTAAGGKFQVDNGGVIQDVRGINLSDGDAGHKKVGLSVVDGTSTASTLRIDSSTLIKGTFGAGTNGTEFTVDGSGNTDVAGGLKVGTSDAFQVSTAGAITNSTGLAIQNASTTKTTFDASSTGLKIGTDTSAPATTFFSVDATNGNTKVGGTLAVGGANAITGTAASGSNPATLDMGANALANVNGITSTGSITVSNGTATADKFVAEKDGSINIQNYNTTTSAYEKVFEVSAAGAVTADSYAAGANGTALSDGQLVLNDGTNPAVTLGVDANGLTVDKKLTVGGANAITGTAASGSNPATLDMGANAVTNVKGLTLTDGAGTPNTVALSVNHVAASGSNPAADYLKVDAGLKVGTSNTFQVDPNGDMTVRGKSNLDGGADVTGIMTLVNSTDNTKKVELTANTSGDLAVNNGLSVAGNNFTVAASTGNTVVGGTLKVGTANAITGTAASGSNPATLDMAANALNNTAGLTVGAANNETFMLGSDGSIKVGTKLGDSTNKVEKFTVSAAGDVTAAVGYTAGANGTALTDNQLLLKGTGSNLATLAGDTNGLVVTEGLKAAGGNFTVTTGTGAVTTTSTLTADGESKFGKDTSGTYSLDVTNAGVTANKVVTAKQGVIFGASDTIAMTSVNHDAAIAAIDNADTSDTTGNNVVASAQAVAKTRDAINDDVNKVLGGIYTINADKTIANYNAAALDTAAGDTTKAMFKTGGTTAGGNLTASLGNLANNINAITGGTISATDGSVNNNYAAATSIAYNTLAASGAKTTSLAQAIGQVDKNIGAAITGAATRTTGAVAGTATVNANLAALDAAIGDNMTVIGGTGTEGSKVAGRTNTAFQTKQNNTVNQNLSALDAAIGVDMTVVGDTGTGIANRTTAAFQTKKANSVNQNLAALDAAIGDDTDLTTTTATIAARNANNGVVVGNSVNANIATLNSAVGDLSNLNATFTAGASTGNAMTNGGTSSTENVVEALNNIDATLGTIHGLKAKLAAAGRDQGNLATGTTVEDHLTSLDAAIGDRSQFAQANYMIENDTIANSLMSVDHNLHRVEKEMRGGFASMAAMSALVPNARAAGDTQISVGVGAYRDHQGMAIGAFHYFNDNVLANFGASYGGDKSTVFRAGVTFGW